MKTAAALILLIVLTACASMSNSGLETPSGPMTVPSTALDLGDWRTASAEQTLAVFENNVASRYGAGLPVSAASADLRRQDFNCGPAPPADNGRGAPPAQVCRRTLAASACTHTWQVHLFDEANNGRLARTRGLYDRRCGGDGLLGGPG